jgi:hypothetical protein
LFLLVLLVFGDMFKFMVVVVEY